MPSFLHEALLELFRRRPTLAAELLDPTTRPRFAHVRIGDSNLTGTVPTERTADLVLLFSDSPDGLIRCAVIVEAQLAVDPDKPRSWWWYVASVHARHQCDALLVVVTPSERVAVWAETPRTLGHPGTILKPIVLGPDAVPVVRNPGVAANAPELAVLSAIVHGKSDAAREVGEAALAAVRSLDEERAALYTDVVLASVHAAARVILEDLMANGTYEYQSDFAKRYVAKGRQEGREEGRSEGRAVALLAVLAARGVDITPSGRERILSCTDVARLDIWLARAANAKSIADVMEE